MEILYDYGSNAYCKNDTCTIGYYAQGKICAPNANAKPAIAKNGTRTII